MKKYTLCSALLLSAVLLSGCGASEADTAPDASPSAEPPAAGDTIGAPEPLTETEPLTEEIPAENVSYIPGTYTGEADAHNGKIMVSVTVDAEKILSITIDEHQEPGGMIDQVYQTVGTALINSNGTHADTVGGATVTSSGFTGAVRDALSKAIAE